LNLREHLLAIEVEELLLPRALFRPVLDLLAKHRGAFHAILRALLLAFFVHVERLHAFDLHHEIHPSLLLLRLG